MARGIRARPAGGFRLLAITWLAIGGALALTIAVLAILGPPKHRRTAPSRMPASAAVPAPHAAAARKLAPHGPLSPDLSLAPVDPALTEPAPDAIGGLLPAIAPDGRRAAQVYAARVPRVLPGQSRVALVLDGLGLDEAESRRAIAELPPAVTLAFSPYGEHLAPLVEAARQAGHEVLVSVPMEPEGSPLNDEGDRQLRPDAPAAQNTLDLEWALSRVAGAVGATGAEAGQSGAHVANASDVLAAALAEITARGLLYLEPNPGHALPAGTDGAVADIEVGTEDAVATASDLASLADDAIRDGHAVGVIGPLTDRTLGRVDAWIRTLPASGIVLVPVSSLARVAPQADPSRE